MSDILNKKEVDSLLKDIEKGDLDDEFLFNDDEPELRSELLEHELDKLLIRFLHPNAPISDIKRIGYKIYGLINDSWNKAQKEQRTKKKIKECFTEKQT